MKKIFTLMLVAMTAVSMKAQMHGAMKFAGKSSLQVSTMNIDNPKDTVVFKLIDAASGDITLSKMQAQGMPEIPSFTIKGVSFSMGANYLITFPEQTFSTAVTVDGVEKTVTGTSLSGTYDMADQSLTLNVVFKYGAMPFPMAYSVKAYYVKSVTNAITVSVGGMFTYNNESVTYNVRKYMDEGVEKLDVEVPQYQLDGTVMGDLTLGSYTIKGLTYNEEKGGFYRDYKDDGLTFHFVAKQNGVATMDNDYSFNSEKDNNILVTYSGNNIVSIVNTFQMGAMPFGIVTTFNNIVNGIDNVKVSDKVKNDGVAYDLSGRRVDDNFKGIVIVNGKKYLRR